MSKQIHRAYTDPTADFAIGHAMLEENRRFRKRVFICSPFAGAIDNNVAAAKRYCAFAIQNDAAPFAPHLLYPQFMDDSLPRRRDEAFFSFVFSTFTCCVLSILHESAFCFLSQSMKHTRRYVAYRLPQTANCTAQAIVQYKKAASVPQGTKHGFVRGFSFCLLQFIAIFLWAATHGFFKQA
ncbi:MAG: DUF4406 domain-containing protein [Ruthenibacterium sp.]